MKRNYQIKYVLFIIGALFMFVGANAQYDAKAKEILDKVSEKYKTMKGYEAKFSYNMHSPMNEIDETQTGKITVSGEKFRLVLDQQEIIVDGKTMWTIMNEEEEVNIMEYEPEDSEITPQNIYTMYQKGYKYVYSETITEGGIQYDVIDLSPEDKDNEFFKIRLTINQTDKTIKSWKIFEKNGNRYLYSIKTFKELPSVSAKEFTFNKASYPGFVLNDLR